MAKKPTTRKPTTKDIVDTEGQGFKMKTDEGDAELEDTEGNRIKLIKGSAVDGDEPEDTEGNRIKLIR